MDGSPDRVGAPPRPLGQAGADHDLLRLAARAGALDAVALLLADGDGAVVAGSWPVDRAGARCEGLDEDACARLLDDAGAPGGATVVAPLPGGMGVLCGRAAPGARDREADGALATLAELVGARLQLEAARRMAEEAGERTAGLVDTGLSLGGEPALDDLLGRIAETAREVVGARYAALGVLDEARTELAEFVTSGITDEQRAAIGDPPRGRGLLGALIRDARPIRLERISEDPRATGFPPNHPQMESFLGAPIALGGEAFGSLYLTDKAGGPFTEEDEQIVMTLASQAAVAVANSRRLDAARRRADELESVQEIARAVLSTLELDALLPMVARRARRLTGAETVGVALAAGDELVVRHADGVDALALEGFRTGREMDVVRADLAHGLGAGAVETSPLEVRGEVAGALVALGARPFDEHARRLLETFSSHVAIALANARAVEAERARLSEEARREAALARERAAGEGVRRAIEAQEAERARLARELHDEAGQAMTALALHLRALEGDVPTPELRERVAGLRQQVASATTALRELATRLRPSALRERGLPSAIRELAERVRADSGIDVEVDLRGLGVDLPEEVQIGLYRVVQEALTNVVRHSGATTASVVATARGDRIRLVVDDDGRGFDTSAPTDHLGLAGIRERVELLGGSLRVESSPGAGTAVLVEVEPRP